MIPNLSIQEATTGKVVAALSLLRRRRRRRSRIRQVSQDVLLTAAPLVSILIAASGSSAEASLRVSIIGALEC